MLGRLGRDGFQEPQKYYILRPYVRAPLPQPNVARVRVTVTLVNAEAIRECSTAGDRHAGLLIVANLRNEILFRTKVKDAALLMSDGNRSDVTMNLPEVGKIRNIQKLSETM